MLTDTHCTCLLWFTVAKEIFRSHNCSTLFSCRGAGISALCEKRLFRTRAGLLWKSSAVCFTSWDPGGFHSGPSRRVCDGGGGAEPGKE